MVFKKKQIIVATMVLLIGTAGYLNWSYDGGDLSVADNTEDYIPIGKSQAVFSQGEDAVKTASEETVSKDQKSDTKESKTEKKAETSGIAKIKLDRDSKRSESIALIKSTLTGNDSNQELKTQAQQKILEIADHMDKEQSIESLISAKGLSDCAVYITDEGVNVITDIDGITESQTAQIREIVYNFTENNNIKIVELNE